MKSSLRFKIKNPKFLFTVLLSLCISVLIGQRGGIVTGKIIDKATGEPLIGAIVQLDSTAIGASTDINGQYRLSTAPGNYTMTIRYFGYEPARVQLSLTAGIVENVDYAMADASALSLQEVVVVANAERSSNVVLNIELKKAPYIASAITATEIRRIPDRTVGEVLKRVTGASIQDGKFVIIRGMNDRYNAGYLDGALLSSTESDRKAFAFDVIPASLIDNLIILKNGSPDLTGDFGGGIIRINTKAVPDKLVQTISLGAQYHSLTTNKPFTEFKRYPGESLNFISSKREVPAFEEDALRLSSSFPTVEDKARLGTISKQFNNDWSSTVNNASPNARVAYSIGFPVSLQNGGRLGVILALNYADTRRRSRNQINTYDGSGQVAGFMDNAYLHNVTTGGIFNVNFINRRTQIHVHNLVNINSDFNTIHRTGTGNFNDALTVQNYAHVLNTNRLYNGIFSWKQVVKDSLFTMDASLSYANILREIPDYRIASYTKTPDFPDFRLARGDFFNNSTGRFTSTVGEHLYTGTFELSKKIGNKKLSTEIKAGYFHQYRDRTFAARSFVYQGNPDETRVDPSVDLGQSNIDASRLYLVEKTSNDLAYYEGESETRAYYLMANQSFGPKFKAVYGVRIEDFILDVHNQKTKQDISSINETAFLPSANLTLALSPKTNLRFGYFSSVNRPEFRELAPFSFYVFDKNAEIRGERDLKIASLNNMDFRYEFYPDGAQLISIGGFYKHIVDPIELSLDVTQPFTTFTYQNEKSATILGIEIELKKKLDFIHIGNVFDRMAVYGNVSLIKSTLKFKEGSLAKNDRPLQGQSPYILNGRLQYENADNGWSANVSVNRVGRRIAFVGVDPNFGNTRQDIYESPRTVVDIQVGKTIGALNIKLTFGDVLHNDLVFYQDADQNGKYNSGQGNGAPGDRLMFIYNAGFTSSLTVGYSF